MNNHIPDAGKMVCPHCGLPQITDTPNATKFSCGTMVWKIGTPNNQMSQSNGCTGSERDQLRARVEELEGWIRSLETHPDSDGHHKSIDPDWQWVAKGRQIYVGTPKPEELR